MIQASSAAGSVAGLAEKASTQGGGMHERSWAVKLVARACSVATQQRTMRCGVADKIDFHGVHHVGLLVKDLKEAKAFYCDTLGKHEHT